MIGVDIGDTYHNRYAAKEFNHYIAEAERDVMRDAYKPAKFRTVLSDGSTDSAIIEQEIVYCRFAVKGKVYTYFLAVQSVPKADASHIADAIDTVASHRLHEEWKSKLVAIGTDGASVMLGKNNGVVTKLKDGKPYVIAVHCMNHRLELSFKDATTKNPCHKLLVDELLLGLYYFYRNSPLNRANLKEAFKTLSLPCLLPTRVDGTRWLSHVLRALENFLKGYRATTLHLEQIQSPDSVGVGGIQQAKARNLYKLIRSLDVISYACFLHDVLFHLASLFSTLQSRNICIGEVHQVLETTKEVLDTMKNQSSASGSMLNKIEDDMFEGVKLSGGTSSFNASKSKLLDDLQDSLNRRFEDVTEGVLEATQVASLTTWPDKKKTDDFGNKEIDTVVDHFRPILQQQHVDITKIPTEWLKLKTGIYMGINWEKRLETATWPQLNRQYASDLPNVLALFDLILTLPSSTAEPVSYPLGVFLDITICPTPI